MENLKTMMELRKSTRVEDCDEGMKKLWEWYGLDLMRRVSRKDWKWGGEIGELDFFSECVLPGDEAFVMAHLEAKIEHYCEIRKAIQENRYEKNDKPGRKRGKKQKEEESAGQLGERYEWYRTEIRKIRVESRQKVKDPLVPDREISLRWNWDYHLRNVNRERLRTSIEPGTVGGGKRFNDMVFTADRQIE